MKDYIFEIEMKVRDYECDAQGIVNNANYQHYMEHTRHEFIESLGVKFDGLHDKGLDPVVARLTLAFKTPLRGGDRFRSCLSLRKEGIKYVFGQDIYRIPDNRIVVKGQVEIVCLIDGRLGSSRLFDDLFSRYLKCDD
ncbi:MAG TPA: acyl-CoA thioesterase [Candidatus Avibacteroides avistercoris]|uniref:Acyl-CoA thioesterase n=1 Tax=Candidatus Avibacteroides avistercoris TaxID=2840690 RepID=A0A9D2ZV32_9BACT|nr:acyl-CoA thioesterase [Candidatus Avibacteroides avistercoris]